MYPTDKIPALEFAKRCGYGFMRKTGDFAYFIMEFLGCVNECFHSVLYTTKERKNPKEMR